MSAADLFEPRQYAEQCMKFALEELRKSGSFSAIFQVISEQGIEFYSVPGNEINNPHLKDALSRQLRARIQETNAHAYVMASDMFMSHVDPNNARQLENERQRRKLGLTIEQAGEIGLLEVSEAVTVICETRAGRTCSLTQRYTRNKVKKEIEITAPADFTESEVVRNGRFAGMFHPPAPGTFHDEWLKKQAAKGNAN